MAVVRRDPSSLTVRTEGLRQEGLDDLRVQVRSGYLLAAAEQLIAHVVAYQRQAQRVIRSGETVAHGFWTTRIVAGSDGVFDVWEYNTAEGEPEWVLGAERTLHYWQGQSELCASFKAEFAPPHGSQMAFVANGVLEGVLPIEGERWRSEAPDSGWILTTALYDGNIRSLKQVHLYHVADARPELYKVLGLPAGYGFRITTDAATSGIWLR